LGVDDLITTGDTFFSALQLIHEPGAEVIEAAAIID